jgi:hypothetical protein
VIWSRRADNSADDVLPLDCAERETFQQFKPLANRRGIEICEPSEFSSDDIPILIASRAGAKSVSFSK